MTNTYQELLIRQDENKANKFLGFAFIGLAVLSVVSAIFINKWYFLLGAVLCGILSYIVYFRRRVVEYAYTYLDKEIRVDRIYNLEKRKKVEVFDLEKAEIVAIADSSSLDNYKNRQAAETDYSTLLPDTDELKLYVMYYEGKRKVYFSFNEDMIQAIRTGIPSKVKLR
ncbi:MAG: hypothetical protein IKI20_03675 [Lachnospiraceae bacterium]|nr:hypothetical protein [Lachnospiraceae bacterium]